jgi:hypothetical protein
LNSSAASLDPGLAMIRMYMSQVRGVQMTMEPGHNVQDRGSLDSALPGRAGSLGQGSVVCYKNGDLSAGSGSLQLRPLGL